MIKTIIVLIACLNIILLINDSHALFLTQEQLDGIDADNLNLQPDYTAIHYTSRQFYANISLLDIKKNNTKYLIYRHTFRLHYYVNQYFIDCYTQSSVPECIREKILPVWIAQYKNVDQRIRNSIKNYQTHQDIDDLYYFNITG